MMKNFNDFLMENYDINIDQFEIEQDYTKRIIYGEYNEYIKNVTGSGNYNSYEHLHENIKLNNAGLRIN